MADHITLTEDLLDDGHEACIVETPSATYWYHLAGGGFSHLIDRDGRDWISYRNGGGPAGEYRGIPNMVFRGPERGYFHPGHTADRASSTEVLHSGPDRVTLVTTSGDGLWQIQWDIRPGRARLQVLRTDPADPTFWFLYEGTPGGTFDPEASHCGRCTGESAPLSEPWDAVLPDGSWVYFTDPQRRQSLFLHATGVGTQPLMYRPMDPMTVFGFGRRAVGVDSCLVDPGASLTIGLVDSVEPGDIARRIEAAI